MVRIFVCGLLILGAVGSGVGGLYLCLAAIEGRSPLASTLDTIWAVAALVGVCFLMAAVADRVRYEGRH